jgi:hypothetical protein
LHLHSSNHGEAFPPTLGHLYLAYIFDGKVFLCPSAGKATPLEVDPCFSDSGRFSRGKYAPAMFGDTHTDYVYVSGLKAADPGHYVLAFDDEWNHDGDGINVLTIGVRIPWVRDIKAVHRQLAKQEKELAAQGRKMKLVRPAWSSWPDPPAGWRPWYMRPSTWARSIASSVLTVLVLMLIVRTVKRERDGREDAA